MNFKEKSVMFFATGCFIGNIPFAPGTFGTIAGLLPCFFLTGIDLSFSALFTIIFIVFAVLIANEAEKISNKKDPGCIVIDEIAGIMVTFIGMPFDLISALSGFFLFRILDIIKPFPIRFLEKNLPGGAGIVLDDVIAGIFSNLVLRGVFLKLGII